MCQITALTNAKDHERLALLKEVAGTKVYEQRRAESLRIMAETDAKRTKINELLDYIESRLAELEEEKEELREFQEKDKERRCLEYALYQRELEEVGEALEEIEEERRGEVHGANMRREQYDTREKEIQVSVSRASLLALSRMLHSVWSKKSPKLSTTCRPSVLHVKMLKMSSPTSSAHVQSWSVSSPIYNLQVNTRTGDVPSLKTNWQLWRNRYN